MKEQIKNQLKSVFVSAKSLQDKVAAEKRDPTPEELTQLADYSAKATSLTKQIGEIEALENAEKSMNQSTGVLSAGTAFSGQIHPDDGAPGDLSDIGSTPDGELYSIKGVSKTALALLKSGEYKDAFNDYLRSTALQAKGKSMKGSSMKVLAEVGFGNGEAWLPPDYRADLVKKIATLTSVRANASVYTTSTDVVTFPATWWYTDDKYTSGVKFTWRGSAAQTSDITEATNPVSGQVKIPVNLGTAAIILQREQFEDNAFDLLGYVTQLGTEAFALGEEDAFTNGTGDGNPLGFLIHPSAGIAVGTNTKVAGQYIQGRLVSASSTGALTWGAASGATPYGIIGTEMSLAPQYEAGAKWFANKKTFAAIRAINAGTATLPQWNLGDSWPNFANGMKANLLGYETQKNQFMPDVAAGNGATVGLSPLVLGDMKGYYIMDRVGLTVEVNPWVYQLRDQVVVYMRKRVGGQLVHYWRMVYCATAA